jgi:hypothetical protein
MRAFAAVARRELAEKKFVFWVTLFLTTLPFLVPAVRQLKGGSARETREIVAVALALGLAEAVALGMGSSMFAGELASRRMGFYFSRPISSFSLWAGKLAGAAVLIAFVLVVSLAPVAIVNRSGINLGQAGLGVSVLVAAPAFILLLVHTLALIVRSRSPLAFVDLAAGVAVGLVTFAVAARLRRDAFVAPVSLLWAVGIAVALALLIASYRAVARGRTDIRTAHVGSSIALWAVLGPATLAFAGYAGWALNAPPSALSSVSWASQIGSEGWVQLEGSARGVPASYLFDARSGRFHRFSGSALATDTAGHLAAWLVGDPSSGPFTLHTVRLDDPGARERETKIAFPQREIWPIFFSADGTRVAAAQARLLNVYEVETGRTLASFPVREKSETISGGFTSPDVVRILRLRETPAKDVIRGEILELDVRSKKSVVTGVADDLRGSAPILRSPYRDEILMNEGHGSRITIRDPRTLAIRNVLRDGGRLQNSYAQFLADGGIVLGLCDGGKTRLEVFTPERILSRTVPLEPARRLRFGGLTSAGKLLLGLERAETGPGPSTYALFVADLAAGSAVRVADRLRPASRFSWWDAQRIEPGSEATKLFVSDDHELVRFDPVTGEKRVLLGGR